MDQTRIWNHFQNDEEIGDLAFNAESRYRYLAKQIKPGQDVLNIGIGRGGLEKLLIEKNANVSCLDPSEESIRNLRSRFDLEDRARVGFSQDIPFGNDSLDVVIMSEVLEHLPDEVLGKTLEEVRRVLRPGGNFVGTVPADENLIASRVVCPDCGKVFHRWGHMQSFSKERLQSQFTPLFSEVTVKRLYFGNLRSLNWKGRMSWAIKRLLLASGFKGGDETFFFSARKLG